VKRLGRRMLGAALLRAETYEEVEADPSSLAGAALVVVLACAAIGLASFVGGRHAGVAGPRLGMQVAVACLLPATGWLAGSALAYMVGASFLRGPQTATDYREVLRTTGFAFAPGILRGLAWLPPAALGIGIDFGASLWVLCAGVVAVRQALDFGTPAAIGTCLAAALLLWLLVWGLSVAPLPL
jgi:hypothetical protein